MNWGQNVAELTGGGTILTTWLDSDDMIHSRFVETVQRHAERSWRPLVIDFPNGYKLRYPDMALSAITSRRPTHFISLLEDGYETVFCSNVAGNHSRIGERFPVLRLQTEPYWVEICHHMNLLNTYQRTSRSAKWHDVKSFFIGPPTTALARARGPMEGLHFSATEMLQGSGPPATTLVCPICGVRSNRFLDFGLTPRRNAMCPACRSLERHRLLWLFLRRHSDLFGSRPKRMLHLAPEPCLSRRLGCLSSVNYLSAYLNDRRAMVRLDVTGIPYQDSRFDVILCNHVLEHIPNDRLAMRELRRVLAPSGWAVFMVPITAATTFEDPRITDPKHRELIFGQRDQVRRYGPDFERRLRECGFKVRGIHPFDVASVDECRLFSIRPSERLFLAIK